MRMHLMLIVCLGLNLVARPQKIQRSNVDYIDPTIGNVGHLLEPTRPLVHLPNQLIRFTPQRQDYLDLQIASFPLTLVSHRLGQVFSLKPHINNIYKANWERKFMYDHDLEVNQPWYYSTYLVEDEVKVEFTPGEKTGIFRFTFPGTAEPALLLGHYNGGKSSYRVTGREVEGSEIYNGNISIYMYGVLSTPGRAELESNRASITFPQGTQQLILKYAISYVSAEQAKENYKNELNGRDFDNLRTAAKHKWNEVMAQVNVEGATESQKRSFYTSLYRYYERMVNITEDGQYYSGYNHKVNQDKRPFYVDDWSWDTYLAQHPLRTILNPAQQEDMLQSYVRMYEQSGWMPTFPVLFGDHACMNGFHSTVVFLDAYRKGLRNFNVNKAYEGARKNATQATLIPWRNGDKTSLDEHYHRHGYFPAIAPDEQETVDRVHEFEKRQAVAVTLGASYDDWALAELAKDLNKKNDETIFAARAQNYKTLWHNDRQLFMPKNDKGEWINIDPNYDGGMGGRDYYDENNGWTYLWQVQHDVEGLIGLLGGKNNFEKKLDRLFTEGLGMSKYTFWSKFPDATGLVGQFSMGNEPSLHIPYLYNFTNAPWKTQQRIRFLLDVWFKDNIFGIPGDEDGGGITSFVVFSAMGFYPVTPGVPMYTIGSPLFTKSSIRLTNGKTFTISAPKASKVNKYIQSVRLNGKPLITPWFTHEQLMNGAHLELDMGPLPNKNWGVRTDSRTAK